MQIWKFTEERDGQMKKQKLFSRKPVKKKLSAEELEKVTGDEVSNFRKMAIKETETFKINTDSEYWACLVFPSREIKDKFLKAIGVWEIGDKYIDGVMFAEQLGIDLEADSFQFPKLGKNDVKWIEISNPLPEGGDKL